MSKFEKILREVEQMDKDYSKGKVFILDKTNYGFDDMIEEIKPNKADVLKTINGLFEETFEEFTNSRSHSRLADNSNKR